MNSRGAPGVLGPWENQHDGAVPTVPRDMVGGAEQSPRGSECEDRSARRAGSGSGAPGEEPACADVGRLE